MSCVPDDVCVSLTNAAYGVVTLKPVPLNVKSFSTTDLVYVVMIPDDAFGTLLCTAFVVFTFLTSVPPVVVNVSGVGVPVP